MIEAQLFPFNFFATQMAGHAVLGKDGFEVDYADGSSLQSCTSFVSTLQYLLRVFFGPFNCIPSRVFSVGVTPALGHRVAALFIGSSRCAFSRKVFLKVFQSVFFYAPARQFPISFTPLAGILTTVFIRFGVLCSILSGPFFTIFCVPSAKSFSDFFRITLPKVPCDLSPLLRVCFVICSIVSAVTFSTVSAVSILAFWGSAKFCNRFFLITLHTAFRCSQFQGLFFFKPLCSFVLSFLTLVRYQTFSTLRAMTIRCSYCRPELVQRFFYFALSAELHSFFSRYISTMRRTSSGTGIPKRLASLMRNARCGSVKEIICLIMLRVYHRVYLNTSSEVLS